MKGNALVLFSGGMDSTTCLFWARQKFEGTIVPLLLNYGQRHDVERECAMQIIKEHKFPCYYVISTDIIKELNNSALVDKTKDVNEKHSRDERLPASFVPGRNILFLTIAGMTAYKYNIRNIVIGVNQQDFSGYPDCRQEFISSMNAALSFGLDRQMSIYTPLIDKTKSQIIELGAELNIYDLILNETHTCYNGDHNHAHKWGYGCGYCEACKLRRKGYEDYNRLNNKGV